MSETGKDKPGAGGAEQRPHATLDLKAKEIFPKGTPEPAAIKPAEPAPAETKAATATLPPPSAPRADAKTERTAAPAADASPPPPIEAAPPASAGGGAILGHMTAGLAGAAIALAGFVFLGEKHGDDEAQRRALTSAEQRISALESVTRQSNGGLEARLKDAADQAIVLRQEIAAVSGRLNTVEGRPPSAAAPAGLSAESVQQSLAPLGARVAQLEASVAAMAKAQQELRASTGEAALTMAVQNLRRAVSEGKPFVSELKTLAALAAEPLEIGPLEARREKGLASLARLQTDFDVSAKAALDAARPSGDGSFTSDLLARARGLVRVRPTGDIPGDAPEAILARAEHRLDDGDLGAAIREAARLAGPAADAMTGWLSEAKARAAADEALARLEARLVTSGVGTRDKTGG